MKFKVLLITAVLSLCSNASFAANWEYVGKTEYFNFYVDNESINWKGKNVKCRVMLDLFQPDINHQLIDKKYFNSVISLWRLDNEKQRVWILSATQYSGKKGGGDIIASENLHSIEENILDMTPDSVGKAISDYVIQHRWNKEEPSTSTDITQ